jgi:DNA-binding response OmpR family regulator
MRILLLEDNPRLAALTAAALHAAGFAVDPVATVADAEHALRTTAYDCLALDLGLPDGDGMDLLARLRRGGATTPVLLVTARDTPAAVVDGLNGGADDYLVKPFHMDELIARIRALLRRPGAAFPAELREGNIALDPAERRATVGNVVLDLSRREVGALELLIRRVGRVLTKAAFEEALYGFGEEVSTNAIEVLIHRLRKKLTAAGAEREIHTLRGLGYLLAEPRP